ncbi:DegT/DnrJ/EryC1/StrS family aminotransferase [Massilia sp. W12]|uniref:DegT/DnrJ/EryC1/StrS family aminotransferase n=1 Tax=Massilia sp. W12 TaxID=3126507 RepID=UPI0030D2839E
MSKLAINGGTPVRVAPFPMRRTMGEAEKQAVMAVMDTDKISGFFGSPGDQWLGGEYVQAFERKWAEAYGFAHAISVNSWSTGLMTAIGAIGIEPGDEVIVSPYTMSASATSILFYGGIPVFADIDPDSFNITADTIAKVISPRTKAIMVVHIFGQAADMDPILALARQHGLKVIEDAAQAPGVRYKGRPVGCLGDIGGFSLNYHKHIHTGEGGVLVTQDAQLAKRCQLIRNHAENLLEYTGMEDMCNMIGSNYRLTEIQAAIGSAQLDKLEGLLALRQRLAAHLSAALQGLPGVTPPKTDPNCGHAYYLYPIKYDAAVTGVSRADLVRAVNAELPHAAHWEQTVLAQAYVKPLYLAALYQKKIALGSKGFPWTLQPEVEYNYAKGSCPVVEKMHEEQMIFTPIVREPLTERDMDDVAAAFHKVLHNLDQIPRA